MILVLRVYFYDFNNIEAWAYITSINIIINVVKIFLVKRKTRDKIKLLKKTEILLLSAVDLSD